MQFLQQQFAAVGVKVTVTPLEAGVATAKLWNVQKPEDATMLMDYTGWSSSTGDADWGLRPLLRSKSFPPKPVQHRLLSFGRRRYGDRGRPRDRRCRQAGDRLCGGAEGDLEGRALGLLTVDQLISGQSKKLSGVYYMPDGGLLDRGRRAELTERRPSRRGADAHLHPAAAGRHPRRPAHGFGVRVRLRAPACRAIRRGWWPGPRRRPRIVAAVRAEMGLEGSLLAAVCALSRANLARRSRPLGEIAPAGDRRDRHALHADALADARGDGVVDARWAGDRRHLRRPARRMAGPDRHGCSRSPACRFRASGSGCC